MMKYRYRFHPDDYALGENEKFYGDMEGRGWRLVSRGAYLSKFSPCEPAAVRYRIEVSADSFMGESELAEEQVAVFEECGWSYVTGRGLLHIFRAPEGSDAPEFYADPRQQAETLRKLRRSYLLSWIPAAAVLLLYFSMYALSRGPGGSFWREGAAELHRRWVVMTPPYFAIALAVLGGVYGIARGAVHISATYRRMRRGIPLDHEPKGRNTVSRVLRWGCFALMGLCAALTVWMLVGHEKYEMPLQADGPYLLLEDLGIEGERGTAFNQEGSTVEYWRSPLAEVWMTSEYIDLPGGDWEWMDQDLYRLRDEKMAERFARTLIETSIFSRDPAGFVYTEAEGLDGAWVSGMEIVAIRDEMAVYAVFSGAVYEDEGMKLRLLAELAEKWKDE